MMLAAGHQIGSYRLDRRLGVGGMAEVWAATHQLMQVQVAVKVLSTGDLRLQARLLREGRSQAAMDHPNILPVRDIITVNGAPGLVMPLVNGPPLGRVLNGEPLPLPVAAALFHQIVQGVAHAHHNGLIHRDLKPDNVLLERRRGRWIPRISDFGLVKRATETSQTQPGASMGTLNYAAPEQILDASAVDHRADLFSLGVLLVELLSGHLPFRAQTLGTLLSAYQSPPDLSGVPPLWVPMCDALLSIPPTDRPTGCAAVLAQIEALMSPQTHDALAVQGALDARITSTSTEAPGAPATTARTWSSPWSSREDALPSHNLPGERDTFIGRQDELGVLAEALGASRLVSVLGPGGTGKTRLLLTFARTHLREHPGGVWFIDLTDTRTLDGIAFAAAQALNVRLRSQDPVEAVGRAIADRERCLIILDNFEQITRFARDTVWRWLEQAPTARFVVTSRIRLNLPDEHIFHLDPLARSEALQLFNARARVRRPGFGLDHSNRAAVTSLVEHLDRLPLAIELAAARIAIMTPHAMLARMDQRFQLLRTRRPDADPRQARLRATIDWSWTLLDDWEKAAFAQCSAFEGGFTLEAAEAVLDLRAGSASPDPDPPWVLDVLRSLVDQTLLRLVEDTPTGELRFRMLFSLQAYAAERLQAQDAAQADACYQRHFSYYADFGTTAAIAETLRTDGGPHWWAMVAERDNLLVAARRAAARKAARAAGLSVMALTIIAERKGPFQSGLAALQATLPLLSSQQTPVLFARFHDHLGTLHNDMGMLDHAARHYQQSIETFQRLDQRAQAGRVLGNLARLLFRQGRFEDAEQAALKALAIHREERYPAAEAAVLSLLGTLSRRQGRMAHAEARYLEAIGVLQRYDHRLIEGNVLGNLGNLYHDQGNVEAAIDHYTRALGVFREFGSRRAEGITLGNLGIIYAELGQTSRAIEHYAQSLTIHRELGDQSGEARTLSYLGRLHLEEGHFNDAERFLQEALTIARGFGTPGEQGTILLHLGALAVQRGELKRGRERLDQSEAVLRQSNERLILIKLLSQRALLEHHDHHPNGARQALDQARALIESLDLDPTSEVQNAFAEAQSTIEGG